MFYGALDRLRASAGSPAPHDDFWYDREPNTGFAYDGSAIRVTPETSLRVSAVLGCVRTLAESVAMAPLNVHRRLDNGGSEIARDHWLQPILHRRPGPHITSFAWRETAMTCLGLRGNFVSLRIGGRGTGRPTGFEPLHPDRLRIDLTTSGALRYHYRGLDNVEQIYSESQVLHLRAMSEDCRIGLSPLRDFMRSAIELAITAEQHGVSTLRNRARPDIVLLNEAPMTPEQALDLRNTWDMTYRGPVNSGKTAVASGGLKPEQLGINHSELQYIEQRKFQIEEICRIFRVPPPIIGHLDRATFNNIDSLIRFFIQFALMAWFERLEQQYEQELLSPDEQDEYFVKHNANGLLRGNAAERAAFYRDMSNTGSITRNEIREREDLNPIEGLDEPLVPQNMAAVAEDGTVNPINDPAGDADNAEE